MPYADHEFHKFYCREYNKKYKKEINKFCHRHHAENRQYYITKASRWNKNHPDRMREFARNFRLRKKIFNMERLK